MLNWTTLYCQKTCCIDVANHLCTNWWHVVFVASAVSRRCWWLQTSYWIRGCVGLSHVGVPVALIFIIFHLSLHATVGVVAPGVDLCHILIVVRAVAAPACCHLSLLRVPHTLELGSNPLAFLHFTRSVLLNLFPLSRCCTRGLCCVGLLPKCSLLLLFVWSSPGCFQDHCSVTMKRFTAVCCLCCCSARLLSVGLGPVVTPGRLKACWTRMPCWHDQMYNCITVVHTRVCCT